MNQALLKSDIEAWIPELESSLDEVISDCDDSVLLLRLHTLLVNSRKAIEERLMELDDPEADGLNLD